MRSRRVKSARIAIVLAAIVAALLTAPAAGQNEDAQHLMTVNVKERAPGGGWRDCPVFKLDVRPITGGCEVRVNARTRFAVATPFGRIFLAECYLRYKGHIQMDGRVALTELETVPFTTDAVCGDIRACMDNTDVTTQPWLGWIEATKGSKFEMRLRACMDTCAGWFDGRIELPLTKNGRGPWTMSGERVEIGESGLELSGEWKLAGSDDLRIEKASF